MMRTTTDRPVPGRLHAPSLRQLDWTVVLLACAVASAALYLTMDVVSSLLYDGYSYKDQTISELSAIGAPTRALWVPLGFIYSGLLVAGAVGIWQSAGERRGLRVIAVLVGIVGIMGFVAWPFAPMHQREVLAADGGTFGDTMHLVFGGVSTVLFFLMLGFGAWTMGGSFRFYTIATIVLMIVFGTLMGTETGDVGNDEPTPWLGIWERLAVEGPIVWISVLATALLLASNPTDPSKEPLGLPT